MAEPAVVDSLGESTYISLTTFRKNGEGVATPVWVARKGDVLYVITDAASGKVKRIKNNPAVLVATCDVRGRVEGETYGGTATVIEGDEVAEVRRLISGKYGLTYRVMVLSERVRPRRARSARVGLELRIGTTE